MDDAKQTKVVVEQKRVRGRNMFDVVNQIVTKYNEPNGWALIRVTPNLLSFEAFLERSALRGEAQEVVVEVTEVDVDAEPNPVEIVVDKKPTATKAGATKASTTKAASKKA